MDLLVLFLCIILWYRFTCVPCFLSDREQHQKHLFGEESLCCSGWGRTSLPRTPNLSYQTSFCLNCKENGYVILLYILHSKFLGNLLSGSACFHILHRPQLQKTLHSGILMDGSGCRNAFLCISSIMMKGPGLAGTGTKALICSFSWAGGMPCTEIPHFFLYYFYSDK